MENYSINGFPVIAAFDYPARSWYRAGRVVIVQRPQHNIHQYVVADHLSTDGIFDTGWHVGDYVTDITSAFEAFKERIVRRYPQVQPVPSLF
jgi:hypothetical protein